MSPSCPLCQSTDHKVVYDLRVLRGRHSVPGLVVRCRRCRMCFKILNANENLAAAYLEGYAVSEGIENHMLSEPARAVFRRVLRGIDLAPRAGRPRLLDIGTGLGGLLEEADKLGFDAQRIDLCEPLVRKARERGLRVECKAAEQLTSETPFDVVTILDAIEHVSQPLALLGAARRVLKPGGELVVYTQNHRAAVVIFANCLDAVGLEFAVNEIFGSNHVSFFDDRTLSAAVRQEGFVVRRMKRFSYDPFRPGQPISTVSLAVVSAVELVGRPFGRVFRLLLYAREFAHQGEPPVMGSVSSLPATNGRRKGVDS